MPPSPSELAAATPTQDPDAIALKVYNKGRALITHYDLQFVPGRTTPVPNKHAESVRKLLADYPILVDAGDAGSDSRAKKAEAEVEALRRRVTELSHENARLQALVAADDADSRIATLTDQRDAAEKRAAELAEQLKHALQPSTAASTLAKQPDRPKGEKKAKES